MSVNLTAVSLFAGVLAGGFDLAFDRARIHTVAAVEIDPAARGVLADRFPSVPLFNDVREVTGAQLRAAGLVPGRGILAGGFPCQDVSVAGRRAGLAGARTGLFYEIARLADETKAQYLLLENVPGLLSSHGGRDMGAILGALGDLGYRWAYRVLDAQFFGVPQRRRRVFIVGSLGDAGAAPESVLALAEGGGGDPAARRKPGSDVADGTGSGAAGGRAGVLADSGIVTSLSASFGDGGPDLAHAQAGWLIPALSPALCAQRGQRYDHNEQAFIPITVTGGVTHTLRAEGADASEDGTGRGTPIVATYVKAARAGRDRSPESWRESDIAPTIDAAGHGPRTATAVAFALRGRDDGAAPEVNGEGQQTSALRAASGGSSRGYLATPTAVRRLTPTECERLQGFPDGWTATSNGKPQKDSPRYRQLGNAVAVPVVEWIAHRFVAADAAATPQPEEAA